MKSQQKFLVKSHENATICFPSFGPRPAPPWPETRRPGRFGLAFPKQNLGRQKGHGATEGFGAALPHALLTRKKEGTNV